MKELNKQLEKIKHLAESQQTLTPLESLLLNFCEAVMEINVQQSQQIQSLKDEINQLKGEDGKPTVRKQTGKKKKDHSSENERNGKSGKKKKAKTGSKKSKAKPDQTIKLTVNREDLPQDAVCDGIKETLIQDIQISTNNTLFVRQQYYSLFENKYYLTPLPVGYEGEYGPHIKSWSATMHSDKEMTLKNITGLFNTAGIYVSQSTVHKFIMTVGENHQDEKLDIAKAAVQATSYQHLDDTGGREQGKNRSVNVLGNEFASVYFTLPHKDRLSIVKMLSFDGVKFSINSLTFDIMRTMQIPENIIALLEPNLSIKYYTQDNIEAILDSIFNGKKQTKLRKLIREASAIAAYQQSPYAIKQLIVDDAPQFKLITEALGLCWVHEGRHYKKLNPIFKKHKKLQEHFISQLWDYYHQLLDYKENPYEKQAEILRSEFVSLFSTVTGYEKLDKQIAITLKKMDPLLLVLKYPHIPLQNNPAEHMAKQQARARDIHLHTMSEEGTEVKDTLLTIAMTARKLSINMFHYLMDRIERKFQMLSLAETIKINASTPDTG